MWKALHYRAGLFNFIGMKRILILLTALVLGANAYAQSTENTAIKQTINTLFEGMRKGDSTMVHGTFANGMVLQSIAEKADGSTTLVSEPAEDFLKAIGTPHKEVFDERITITDIKVDGALASVWAPYKFYMGNKFSHCGVDVFQLMKIAAGWKIIYIVDTRRKDDCVE